MLRFNFAISLLLDLGISFYEISSLFLIDNIRGHLYTRVFTLSRTFCSKFNLFIAVTLVLFYNCQLEHCSSSFCSIIVRVHVFVLFA